MVRIAFLLPLASLCQSLPPKPAYPHNIKQLHCGHSLTAPLFNPWPGQWCHLIASLNGLQAWQVRDVLVGDATLPGAWLRFHWDTTLIPCGQDPSYSCYGPNLSPTRDISQWDLLVITENYEGPMNLTAQQSLQHLSLFVNHAWQHGRGGQGAPTLLWTNWAGIDGSPYYFGDAYGIPAATDGSASGWRRLMDSLEVGWQIMQDHANSNRPSGSPPVYIIPGNRIMVRLYDDIRQGRVAGLTHISQVFTDGVHPNDTGAYLVTLVHYACLFNANPIGLSHQLQPGIVIPPALAAYFQQMVWEVVTSYPRSGLTHLGTALPTDERRLEVYPNPAQDYVWVLSPWPITPEYPILIRDLQGRLVRKQSSQPVRISDLPVGTYEVEFRGMRKKVVKL
ncbi:MAG: T9SS type A sorting domain-containing protein [Bacteroidia bacterium]|nr:T9SS type A sorting domain-containing protein [Bacteroidia bacterium]